MRIALGPCLLAFALTIVPPAVAHDPCTPDWECSASTCIDPTLPACGECDLFVDVNGSISSPLGSPSHSLLCAAAVCVAGAGDGAYVDHYDERDAGGATRGGYADTPCDGPLAPTQRAVEELLAPLHGLGPWLADTIPSHNETTAAANDALLAAALAAHDACADSCNGRLDCTDECTSHVCIVQIGSCTHCEFRGGLEPSWCVAPGPIQVQPFGNRAEACVGFAPYGHVSAGWTSKCPPY